MPKPTVILIAAPDFVPALRERLGSELDVTTFADSEAVRAVKTIVEGRPDIIVLERLFAATPRGAALIARVKQDAALEGTEIRIVSHNSGYQRVSPRRPAPPREAATASPARRLDPGTRRAPRFPIKSSAHATLDGQPAQVVNLSAVGAQVLAPGTIEPRRAVTLELGPAREPIVLDGTVVWARPEISRKGAVSRIGIDFASPDRPALERYITAHRLR